MPGFSAKIHPENNRCWDPSNLRSLTSIKEFVEGGSVGGLVLQTFGMIVRAPNFVSLPKGISRVEMRAVTLFNAANTATLFLISVAWAVPLVFALISLLITGARANTVLANMKVAVSPRFFKERG